MSSYLQLAKKVVEVAPAEPPGSAGAEQQERRFEVAVRQGLIVKWSEEPGWISLHDPTTGGWHDFPARDCLPSIVAEAGTRKKGGAA